MSKMRAARLVEIGRMDCEEIKMGPLEPGNVRVQTEMASICGSDLHRVMMGALMDHELPCPHGYPGHEGIGLVVDCLLYTSPSPRDATLSRMPSSA